MAHYLRSRIIIGLMLVLVGILFILNNYGIEIIPEEFFTWEYLFILLGVLLILLSKNIVAGIIFISIGLFSLLPELWPLIFVIIGLLIIFRRRSYNKYFISTFINETKKEEFTDTQKIKTPHSIKGNEYIEEISIFGGTTRVLYADNFMGGSILSIFGGSEIDLSNCKLADGVNVLEITAIFGGATLIVPSRWKVEIDVLPIFGGFSDKRIKSPNINFDEGKSLMIKGFVLFGGGEIKNTL